MEFAQITITNFLSYYNENTFDFSPYTTIIIGQNNTGKSKLFDAINFAIYERIYDTLEEKWLDKTNDIAPLILNKYKIKEALKNNEKQIDVSVSLLISDVSSSDITLNIERRYSYKLEDNKYVFTTKTLTVNEIDNFDGSTSPYIGVDAEDRIVRYFSKSIKNFFLFQGEAASKIMQLHSDGNFSLAVKEIARLELFETAKTYADKYQSSISRAITTKLNKNKRVAEERERLNQEIEMKKNSLKQYISKKEEASKANNEYSDKLDKLENELNQLKIFEEYFNKKKEYERDFNEVSKNLKELEEKKSVIGENTFFYKVRDKIASFKDFYSKLEKKGEVPPSVPQAEIRKALDCCRCTICNSDLSQGTEGRKFAESRLSTCDTDKLGSELRQLNYVMGDESEEIKKVPDILQNLITQKRKIENRKVALREKKQNLEAYLNNLQYEDEVSEEKINQLNKIKKEIQSYTNFKQRAVADFNNADGSLTVYQKEIKELENKLSELIIDDDDISDEDKIKMNYATRLSEIMKRLFDVANNTAYAEVESRANEFYKEMTKNNAALVGDIKIDLKTSEIYTVDEDKNRILNINQGNRISIQLAVIAGILTVAQDQFGIQYPFVTDAPVSHLGGDNKRSTVETMINAFEQSIIIIKDDKATNNTENDEIRKLIFDSSDVGIAYELKLSDAESINDQYTVIKKIKG